MKDLYNDTQKDNIQACTKLNFKFQRCLTDFAETWLQMSEQNRDLLLYNYEQSENSSIPVNRML